MNAHPSQLDLDWRFIETGKGLGCKFAIGLDAHQSEDFDNAALGVAMSRKGWLGKEDVLNCLGAAQLRRWFTGRRKRR